MTGLAQSFANKIQNYGTKSSPLVGTPRQPLIFADKLNKFVINGKSIEAGYFGIIPEPKVKSYLSKTLLESILNLPGEAVPVIAALSHQWAAAMPEGGYQPLNVDGDEVMMLVANHVSPEEFLFVTASGGVKKVQGGMMYVVPRLFDTDFETPRSSFQFDEGMRLKLHAAFTILREHNGARVALVPPDNVVPYLLDRDTKIPREHNDLLYGVPPHRGGVYGTTLLLHGQNLEF